MTRYAIDAPTLVRLVTEDGHVAGHQLVAPNALRSQALDLLYRQVREDELSEREAFALHDRITETKVRLLGDRMSRRTAWRIAAEQGWAGIHEAEYLAVTRLQADALVTVDPELAARADGVVPLAPYEALFTT